MKHYTHAERLTVVGLVATVVTTIAGAVALHGATGVLIASTLLTFDAIVVGGGVAYARDRRLGIGIWLLIAATLPLFGLLYAVGITILRQLGPTVAGGLLLLLAVGMGAATTYHALHFGRHYAGRRMAHRRH